MFKDTNEKIIPLLHSLEFTVGMVKFHLLLVFFACFTSVVIAQVASPENSERSQGVGAYRNQKLSTMSTKEFEEIFKQGRVRQGSSFEEVENSLGRPTEIKPGRNGTATWIYDGSALTGGLGHLGISRAGRFNYAILVFSAEGLVSQLRYKIVE